MSETDAAPPPHAPAHPCPRCKQALERAEMRKVPVEACRDCKGTLVTQGNLAWLLDELSTPLLSSLDPDAKLEAAKHPSGRVDCPKCTHPMDRDDYCAAGLVFFDRCAACALLWFDADELGAMSLMWARMNARQARMKAINRAMAINYVLIDRDVLASQVWGSLLIP
jgi:Zn-finger nucleic acid-binding protein